MSGYSDNLSSYYNIAGINNNTSLYSLLNRALAGVGSGTGLESLNELSGQDDDSSFMSVLSAYMGNNILNTNNNAADSIVTDRLQKALETMDVDSDEYDYVKEAYEYLAGKSLGKDILNGAGGLRTESKTVSEDAVTSSERLNIMNPDVLIGSLESEIEEYIENSIETAGL